jgi:hypothetical protein
VITVEEARARGILSLPVLDVTAQQIVDEQEAWLARRIGPLEGERTETFYVGQLMTHGKLGLRRYTDEVDLTDGTVVVDEDDFRLVDNGSAVVRSHTAIRRWWSGPYVSAMYNPNDYNEVRRILFDLVSLAAAPVGPYNSESIGDYSYSHGLPGSQTDAQTRAALVSALLPKRDAAFTISAVSRSLRYGDPVINRAEPEYA